jgi:hypothetical protein
MRFVSYWWYYYVMATVQTAPYSSAACDHPAYQLLGLTGKLGWQTLIDWAFTHPSCSVITATEVENLASRRLLERLGARLVSASGNSTNWEIIKLLS